MSSDVVRVWAVVATYRRPRELGVLLDSLAAERPMPAGVLIVDNGGDAATAAVLASAPLPVRHLVPGQNLGCGGGVALGLRAGLGDKTATHFWQFDDDAEIRPGALAALLDALQSQGADVAVPLIVDPKNRVSWFPGPLPDVDWRAIGREVITPQVFSERFGSEPLAWTWSPWTSLLVSRRAVEQVGFPRDDYWFQGEDIEYTLRLSARFRCVLAPGAVCVHHVDIGRSSPESFLKKSALLQNNTYTFTRLPHGRRARRHLPGNYWRFLREEWLRPAACAAALAAFWRGAIWGRPAGVPGFDRFRRAWENRRC